MQYISRFYPEAIIVAGRGENQDTSQKPINSWKKGYMKGQPDIMILNYNKSWKGFKTPCQHCSNHFLSNETYQIHLEKFHKL